MALYLDTSVMSDTMACYLNVTSGLAAFWHRISLLAARDLLYAPSLYPLTPAPPAELGLADRCIPPHLARIMNATHECHGLLPHVR